ncbi:hypothetical protein CMQ_8063 [Grosmannia clavigera kw1407]|uniref:Peptidase C14 caspase domain-containing protein n=1 Tax=Grosmannia clavigera (strain kw1407 / UAMH 11150) TaxID=655863 RepID=F0XKH1_GROCL|nr:uncharacterized protein CMQ_8063 [Grosmannia clavigera kw1407]EFX01597.1 hypothetical protein CMQ_8063 [Grosmannia clavigera kw1407]
MEKQPPETKAHYWSGDNASARDSGTSSPLDPDNVSTDSHEKPSSSSHTDNSAEFGAYFPPEIAQVAHWREHIGLSDFAIMLQQSLKGAFPKDNASQYTKAFVLLVYWEVGVPSLPIEPEIIRLRDAFTDVFNFEVEMFQIPTSRSHIMLSRKINDFVFLNDDSKDDLKIFYYGGHGKLTKSRELLFSNNLGHFGLKEETLTWSGIQSTLEKALSDVLILLDCGESGMVRFGEGHGVTELVASCSYDAKTSGFGEASFTKALVTELKSLAISKLRFTASDLWAHIYNRMQCHIPTGHSNDRYPAPVHFFITRDSDFDRSIDLTPLPPTPINRNLLAEMKFE